MRQTFAALLVALVASPLAAQIKGPSSVDVPVGKLAPVSLTVDGEEAVYEVLGGDYFGAFREYSGPKEFRFQVFGYKAGSGHLVLASTKGGKLQPIFTVKVTVTGPAPPPPVPPIPPPVPPPIPPDPPPFDSLALVLQQAATKDGWPAANLATYGRGFATLAQSAIPATVGEVASAQMAKLTQALGAGVHVPINVRAVVANELNTALPAAVPTKQLTDAERAAVKKCYERLALSLERASK